jgi:hypothetical protein
VLAFEEERRLIARLRLVRLRHLTQTDKLHLFRRVRATTSVGCGLIDVQVA